MENDVFYCDWRALICFRWPICIMHTLEYISLAMNGMEIIRICMQNRQSAIEAQRTDRIEMMRQLNSTQLTDRLTDH